MNEAGERGERGRKEERRRQGSEAGRGEGEKGGIMGEEGENS